MEEIKVGEYIRTINGNIGIFKGNCLTYLCDYEVNGDERCCSYKYITKHSSNITDLIEVRRLCKWI